MLQVPDRTGWWPPIRDLPSVSPTGAPAPVTPLDSHKCPSGVPRSCHRSQAGHLRSSGMCSPYPRGVAPGSFSLPNDPYSPSSCSQHRWESSTCARGHVLVLPKVEMLSPGPPAQRRPRSVNRRLVFQGNAPRPYLAHEARSRLAKGETQQRSSFRVGSAADPWLNWMRWPSSLSFNLGPQGPGISVSPVSGSWLGERALCQCLPPGAVLG